MKSKNDNHSVNSEKNDFFTKADLCFRYDNEVQNGGHLQYFENTSNESFYDHQEVINALIFFRANTQAEILAKAVAIRMAEKRGQILSNDEYVYRAKEGKYDSLDNEYYKCKPDVSQLLENAFDDYEGEPLTKGSLVAEYKKLAKIVLSDDDYSNSIQTARRNRAAKQMRKLAASIEIEHPEEKSEFMLLLSDIEIQGWVAHDMLEVMNYDKIAQKSALNVIKKLSKGDGVNALGNKMWLKKWYKENQRTKRR